MEIDDEGTKSTSVKLTNDILQKILKLSQGIKHLLGKIIIINLNSLLF